MAVPASFPLLDYAEHCCMRFTHPSRRILKTVTTCSRWRSSRVYPLSGSSFHRRQDSFGFCAGSNRQHHCLSLSHTHSRRPRREVIIRTRGGSREDVCQTWQQSSSCSPCVGVIALSGRRSTAKIRFESKYRCRSNDASSRSRIAGCSGNRRIEALWSKRCVGPGSACRCERALRSSIWGTGLSRIGRTTCSRNPNRRAEFSGRAFAKEGAGDGDRGDRGGRGGGNAFRSPQWDPLFAEGGASGDCPVPAEQQPINEYRSLLESSLFPWPTLSPAAFSLRLAAIGLSFSMLIGWPVASLSFRPEEHILLCILASLSGGLGASSMAVIRLYMGWAYVGNRLFSATVEYEETGWYDGEVWVKPPEVLARDRLLGSYKVKPALGRLKVALVALGVSLIASTGSIAALTQQVPPSGYVDHQSKSGDGVRMTYAIPYSDQSARRYEPGAFVNDEPSVQQQINVSDTGSGSSSS